MNRIDKFNQLVNSLIAEEKARMLPQYRDEIKTLESTSLERDFKRDLLLTAEAVEAEDLARLKALYNKFTRLAEDYNRPWYDEDLNIMRSGYKWESELYKALAEICR